jgi:hypothetical protein
MSIMMSWTLLLSAVAVYASGGIKALSDHAAAKGGAAAKLIGQMR